MLDVHELCVTPSGSLTLIPAVSNVAKFEGIAELSDDVIRRFQKSCFDGLTMLATHDAKTKFDDLPPPLDFWRQYARRYFASVCRQYSQASSRWVSPKAPDEATLTECLNTAPPMRGIEYLTTTAMQNLWTGLDDFTKHQVADSKQGVAEYLKQLDPG